MGGFGEVADKFEVKVFLRDTQTGDEGWYTEEYNGPGEDALLRAIFMWTDGNWSCDCNRCLFLWEWSEEPGHDLLCNVGKNRIEIISFVFNGEDKGAL